MEHGRVVHLPFHLGVREPLLPEAATSAMKRMLLVNEHVVHKLPHVADMLVPPVAYLALHQEGIAMV